ncbi:hypothetical protein LPC08_23390 [Roseomonas sp. OT10]|uniref:hypothetical protein n=1 Tax=Roseomonas cutis TaxID=2897332 RepID=UPI001E2EF16E|nr:hypothetical protein [Roseomonas sp. OT10]UFN48905.1 hypothetical protein LPC08_23390 [Roseomonas sp. OT10]
MQLSFTISGMEPYQKPIVRGPWKILARMTVEAGPFLFAGATFSLRDDGTLHIRLGVAGRQCRVAILDSSFRRQLTRAASDTYRALTGCDPADTPLAKASSTAEVPS